MSDTPQPNAQRRPLPPRPAPRDPDVGRYAVHGSEAPETDASPTRPSATELPAFRHEPEIGDPPPRPRHDGPSRAPPPRVEQAPVSLAPASRGSLALAGLRALGPWAPAVIGGAALLWVAGQAGKGLGELAEGFARAWATTHPPPSSVDVTCREQLAKIRSHLGEAATSDAAFDSATAAYLCAQGFGPPGYCDRAAPLLPPPLVQPGQVKAAPVVQPDVRVPPRPEVP